jgi:signal peptidase I
VLSLLVPGLGHLYAGDARRGVVVWLATRVATAGLLEAAVAIGGRPGLAVQAAGAVAVWAIAAADAARATRRAPPGSTLRWYNNALVYLGVCAVMAAGTVPWHVLLGDTVAEMRRVPNNTMAPALVAGDHVYAVPRRGGDVQRGEIVVYRKWGTGYIKRVAGVGGDTLAMRGGVLSVDQRPVREPYAIHTGEGEGGDRRFVWQRPFVADTVGGAQMPAYAPTVATWGPIVVPRGEYFLLGDNRGESIDSRYTGFVADSEIIARPVMISYSVEPCSLHLRWGRFGQRVEE